MDGDLFIFQGVLTSAGEQSKERGRTQHTPTEGNLSPAFYSMHTCRTAGDNINIYRNQRPGRIYHTFKIHFPHLMPLSDSDFPLSFFLSEAFISVTYCCTEPKGWRLVAKGEQGSKHMPSFHIPFKKINNKKSCAGEQTQVNSKFANAFERGVQRGPRPLGVHSSTAGGP